MCAERLEQLRLKEEEAKERKAHDDLYAQLWEKDRQEKVSHLRELTNAFDIHAKRLDNRDLVVYDAYHLAHE